MSQHGGVLNLLKSPEPAPLDDLADTLAKLTAVLDTLKPARLVAAENAVTAARTERATLSDRYRAACGEAHHAGATKPTTEMRGMAEELTRQDEVINGLKTTMRAERERFGPKAIAATQPFVDQVSNALRVVAPVLCNAGEILRQIEAFRLVNAGDASPAAKVIDHATLTAVGARLS